LDDHGVGRPKQSLDPYGPEEPNRMTIADRAVLVTGANRGIGRALVDEALRRDANRVYAGTRRPLAHSDERVTPLTLDVTKPEQIRAAVEEVESLDILVNNAGVAVYDDLTDRAALDLHLAVNFFGTHGMSQAFLPFLTRSQGAIVDGVENGDEEIFPDPMSKSMADSWRSGAAKALERQYAALVAEAPAHT
jgi:nucleoside-diphosphate-sugar epimerase